MWFFYSSYKDYTLQSELATIARTWSEILFTMLQVHLEWISSINLMITSMEWNGLNRRRRGWWGNVEAISHKRQQNLGQGREVKLGKVSLFLCLDVKWDPETSFYMKKGWLFGWVTGYSMWIGWETSNSPWISLNSLQLFNFCKFFKNTRYV